MGFHTGGLHHPPVQNHHDRGPVGAQESRVLQRCLLGLSGGIEPHALGALGDEFTEQTNEKQPQGQTPLKPNLPCSSLLLEPRQLSTCCGLQRT